MKVVVQLLFLVVPVAFWAYVIRRELQKPKGERFGSTKWHWPAAAFAFIGVIGFDLLLVFATSK